MTIKQELITYAKRCISGKIISCTKHNWACQRFLDDLKRSGQKDCPFVWNEKEAQKIFTSTRTRIRIPSQLRSIFLTGLSGTLLMVLPDFYGDI